MAEVDVYTGHGAQPAIAGRLSASQQQHVFSYRHDAREALSLTMPLRHESYSYAQLHPIFQMNLPEGALREALERMTAKQYGSDDLTLLTILGTHQIGRMAYALADQPLRHPTDQPLTLQALLNNPDANLFSELFLPHDTMALTLTGSKRWPKRKVLHTFARHHCLLDAQQIEASEAAVEQAIQQNLPLLERLQQQYTGFAPIAERLYALLITPPTTH